MTSSENISREFVIFINSHRKLIYKVCRIYCRNDAQMKDVEQEIVARLWTAFPKYDPVYRPSTWIYRIAINTAISFYRKEKKYRSNRMDIDQTVFQLAADEDSTGLNEQIEQLYRVIEGFPELDRALLLLYLDDNSYEEIAGVLGITVTNVATKISRLKQRLRQLIVKSDE